MTGWTEKIPKGFSYCTNVLSENTVSDLAQNFMIIMPTSVMQKKKKKEYIYGFVFLFFFQSIFLNPKDNLYCQFNKMKSSGCLPGVKSTSIST